MKVTRVEVVLEPGDKPQVRTHGRWTCITQNGGPATTFPQFELDAETSVAAVWAADLLRQTIVAGNLPGSAFAEVTAAVEAAVASVEEQLVEWRRLLDEVAMREDDARIEAEARGDV